MGLKFTVSDCMTKSLITINENADIGEAIRTLLKYKISGMPVVDDNENMTGILSEKDCLRPFVDSKYHEMPQRVVKDVMSKDVVAIQIDDDILKVTSLFVNRRFRRLPVMSGGKLVGQVSRRDVLRAIDKLD